MVGNRSRPIAHFAATVRVARKTAPGYWRQYRRERTRVVIPAPHVPQPANWPDSGVHAAWLGHSTVLLKIDGFTVLTDPVLGERCGVYLGPATTVGIKRLVSPALERRDLPHIDLILLSHAHFDHFDRATLRSLERRGTAVVTAVGTSNLLRGPRYGSVEELGWDAETRIGPLQVRAFEVNHWGARIRTDTYRGYNGYVLETGNRRILFGGDTAYTESFRKLRSARPADLAIMPIGAYDPWIHVHCNPEQALRMANEANAQHVLPVHHQTFKLSREPFYEPVERLLSAAGRDTDRIAVQRIGQEWHLQ